MPWRPPAVTLEYFHFGKRIAGHRDLTSVGFKLQSDTQRFKVGLCCHAVTAEARRPLQTGPAYKSERI
jgi:hypothetical protein